ncbi:hypothetical protein M409DRAFT_30332 [Zasmidium cellare ATCC 36951]|uniref:Uncharacterized protein n=1 Tax=Zasmidium cellare ATCC 36951 TaxID=1080233 RepID=A0A6A6C027_ZASCE|nr:uncharacterized protein M409DRAFT_30332 [Zasmidium cellare ATCC 36951]KAF2159192.1 hypothetical protein M409DRAFT_30332 [Zasmidium cellare ATCC 36951]
MPIFYGDNKFNFRSSDALETFASVTSPRRLRHLKVLHFSHEIREDMCLAADARLRAAVENISNVVSLDEMTITFDLYPIWNVRCRACSCDHTNPRTVADVPSLGALLRIFTKAKKSGVFLDDYLGANKDIRSIINEFTLQVNQIMDQKKQEIEDVEGNQEDSKSDEGSGRLQSEDPPRLPRHGQVQEIQGSEGVDEERGG